MTFTEWEPQWARLDHYYVAGDRVALCGEWFGQLKHLHVDAVDAGITALIGQTKDTRLPGLGTLKELIQARMDRYERTTTKCPTCHGACWLDSAPFIDNAMIYENVVIRCPDCGTPPPAYVEAKGRRPLSRREYAEWKLGDAVKDYMPPGLEAKPSKADDLKAEMKAAMQRLRVKLFGGAI